MRIAIIGLWDIIATSVGEPPLEAPQGKTGTSSE
ncbi:hypothetical protein SAMN04488529_11662 [Clostridium gasigenes]|uniref:Uncharacterized protein n=1 Tax=Clostridium gasigenes TaxID=94869 RepID=A0A1H0VGA4_9CLOT|nr:hypothetical protein SAMN04488529_11662 [Clostridium gasigenes]